MSFRIVPLLFVFTLSVTTATAPLSAAAQTPSAPVAAPAGIAGVWVLNPALTERPAEIGFTRDWADAGRMGGRGEGPGGYGRGRGGGMAEPPISRESYDDATRVEQLTEDVRTPPKRLTIVRQPDNVSIADDQGRFRVFHPDGRQEELRLGTVPLPTTTRWDKDALVIAFDVAQGRQLRYTLTPLTNPARLLVTVTFVEGGRAGDEVRLTYETLDAADSAILAATRPSSPDVPAGAAPVGAGVPSPPPDGLVPATRGARSPVLPPGSELRGLTTIGTVVEQLSASAAACGLDQQKLQTTVARILSDGGFTARPFDDDDAYVLVSVVTSRLPDGTCVSRYDASLEAQADATFPYVNGLVSLPVQLLHDGGMAGGASASHAASVTDALTKSVRRFVDQIHAAAK